MKHRGIAMLAGILWIGASCTLHAEAAQIPGSGVRPSKEALNAAAGDTSETPGRIDNSLSAKWTHRHVRHAMKKVANWSLRHSAPQFTQDWTYVPLYSGLLAASQTTGDSKYHDAVLRMAEGFHWQLLQGRYDHADDEALGQIYEALYEENRDPLRIASVKENLENLLVRPDDPKKNLWWWCDALYMAPPSLAKMSEITGDPRYIHYADREEELTTSHLYNAQDALYFRDASFLNKKEQNGKPLYWSRGNGWVFAGTAHLLSTMRKDDPLLQKYQKRFRDMADRIAALQPTDGLWRPGLLDPDSYPAGEISGTGFFAYAMAWGVNNGLLDRGKFTPIIEKAWAGMLQHVYKDGRLGNIQPIGAAPGEFEPGSSYVYGVGAFLLAGSEIDRMIANAGAKSGPQYGSQ